MRKRGVSSEQVEAARKDVNGKRYRPEEVVGAAVSFNWPVGFDDAEKVAKQILVDLKNARAKPSGTP
jgi:hypothetical protein